LTLRFFHIEQDRAGLLHDRRPTVRPCFSVGRPITEFGETRIVFRAAHQKYTTVVAGSDGVARFQNILAASAKPSWAPRS